MSCSPFLMKRWELGLIFGNYSAGLFLDSAQPVERGNRHEGDQALGVSRHPDGRQERGCHTGANRHDGWPSFVGTTGCLARTGNGSIALGRNKCGLIHSGWHRI
jgi:hypothetical protein